MENKTIQNYRFNILNFNIVKNDFFLTMQEVGQLANYRFVYAPFSRYPSLLMLDFYVARKNYKQSIYNELVNAISREVGSEKDFIVVIGDKIEDTGMLLHGKDIADRIEAVYGLDQSGFIEGRRVDLWQGYNSDPISGGWRVHNNKLLTVVRNIANARSIVKLLSSLYRGILAQRVDLFGADFGFIDKYGRVSVFEGLSQQEIKKALRVFLREIAYSGGIRPALRPYLVAASVLEGGNSYDRISEGSLILDTGNLSSVRLLTQGVEKSGFSLVSVRHVYHDLYDDAEIGLWSRILNNNDMVDVRKDALGWREVKSDLELMLRLLKAKRDQEVEAVIQALQSAKRKNDGHYLDILSNIFWGELKVHQYPLVLHGLMYSNRIQDLSQVYFQYLHQSNRDIRNKDLYIVEGQIFSRREVEKGWFDIQRLGASSREKEFLGESFEGLAAFNRLVQKDLSLWYTKSAVRDIREQVHLEKGANEGKRIFVVLSDVGNLKNAERNTKVKAHISEDGYATRFYKMPAFLGLGGVGERNSSSGLSLSNYLQHGSRLLKELLLAQTEPSSRNEKFSTSLEVGLSFYRDHVLGIFIPNMPGFTANRDSHHDLTSYFELLLDSVRLNSHNASNYRDLIQLLRIAWNKHLLYDDRSAFRFIFGGGWKDHQILPGYLHEDMIIADILQNRPAVLLEALINAVYVQENQAYFSEDFIAGIKDRINILIDSGVLVAAGEDKKGIVTIDYSVAELLEKVGQLDVVFPGMIEKRGALISGEAGTGVRFKEDGSEISEVVYGEEFTFRPARIEVEDPLGYITDRKGFAPDEPALGKGERGGGELETNTETARKPLRSSFDSDYAEYGWMDRRGGSDRDELRSGGVYRRSDVGNDAIGTPALKQMESSSSMNGGVPDRHGDVASDLLSGDADEVGGVVEDAQFKGASPVRLGDEETERPIGGNSKTASIGEDALGGLPLRVAEAQEININGKLIPDKGCIDDSNEYGHRIKHQSNMMSDDVYGRRKQIVQGARDDGLAYAGESPKKVEVIASDSARIGGKESLSEDGITLLDKDERSSDVVITTHGASLNEKDSLLEENTIVAILEKLMAEAVTGFIFAEIEEERVEYLKILQALLPPKVSAMLEEYHLSKAQKDGFYERGILAEEFKYGLLESLDETTAQGLIFDYNDDLLQSGQDIETWRGGYGVPEDYDPYDPFNVYYPYSVDMNTLELSQLEDWVKFGDADWERDKMHGKFYSKSDTQSVSGWYLNNFNSEEYRFEVDFKVEDDDNDGVGIVFKFVDEQNYWMFMVSGGDFDGSLGMTRPMQLYKVVNGVSQPIGSPMQPYQWQHDTWHRLSVTVLKDRITIFTDGRLQYDLIGQY